MLVIVPVIPGGGTCVTKRIGRSWAITECAPRATAQDAESWRSLIFMAVNAREPQAEIISPLCKVKINSHVQWNVSCRPRRSKGAGQRLAVLADPAHARRAGFRAAPDNNFQP